MTEVTFDALLKAASKLPSDHEVVKVLMSAEVNANDTIYVEKAATKDEWERIALGSIGCLFDSHTKPATLRWFKKRGYRW